MFRNSYRTNRMGQCWSLACSSIEWWCPLHRKSRDHRSEKQSGQELVLCVLWKLVSKNTVVDIDLTNTVRIWYPDMSRLWMLMSWFHIGSEIQKPDHLNTWLICRHLVLSIQKLDNLARILNGWEFLDIILDFYHSKIWSSKSLFSDPRWMKILNYAKLHIIRKTSFKSIPTSNLR